VPEGEGAGELRLRKAIYDALSPVKSKVSGT
jgi:hypothetical protein